MVIFFIITANTLHTPYKLNGKTKGKFSRRCVKNGDRRTQHRTTQTGQLKPDISNPDNSNPDNSNPDISNLDNSNSDNSN